MTVFPVLKPAAMKDSTLSDSLVSVSAPNVTPSGSCVSERASVIYASCVLPDSANMKIHILESVDQEPLPSAYQPVDSEVPQPKPDHHHQH